jgi:hypothetical protein
VVSGFFLVLKRVRMGRMKKEKPRRGEDEEGKT